MCARVLPHPRARVGPTLPKCPFDLTNVHGWVPPLHYLSQVIFLTWEEHTQTHSHIDITKQ